MNRQSRWTRMVVLAALVCVGCQGSAGDDAPTYASFGDAITADGATELNTIMHAQLSEEPRAVKVTGTVESVCQNSGCWMKLVVDDADDVMVTFKDYGFFVPKDIAGGRVVLEGVLQPVERSVDELRHLAEDAGKSEEEIQAITEPEVAYGIEATGVLVEQL